MQQPPDVTSTSPSQPSERPALESSPPPHDKQTGPLAPLPVWESSIPTTNPPAEAPAIPDPPPDFSPFFTLLSSGTRTHHPTTHYIFADDPPDSNPITATALDVLDPPSPSPLSSASPTSSNEREEDGASGRVKSSRRRDRYVILDLDASGTKVVNMQSMSSDWAVTAAEIGTAPTWDVSATMREGEHMQRGGMMLNIEGVEGEGVLGGTGSERTMEKGKGREDGEEGGVHLGNRPLEELVEEYEQKMRQLRKVIGAIGGYEGAVGKESGQHEILTTVTND